MTQRTLQIQMIWIEINFCWGGFKIGNAFKKKTKKLKIAANGL